MIDIQALVAQLRAKQVHTRIGEWSLAWEFARGTYHPADGEITPLLAGDEHARDWQRLSRLVKAVGERALHLKTTAAVGSVSWGDPTQRGAVTDAAFSTAKTQNDEAVSRLRLAANAHRLAEQWLVDGLIAVHAYRNARDEPRLARLTGYLEPYLSWDDMDELEGLYQTKFRLNAHGHKKWWVRIYDWTGETTTIREWHDLNDPLEFSRRESATLEGVQRPIVRIGPTTEEGLVISRFLSSLSLMRGVMATDLRLERVEEFASYPVPVVIGDAELSVISPAVPIRIHDNGDFKFVDPGGLVALRARLQEKLSRFELEMNLPSGSFGASQSGESIREMNLVFFQDAQSDANLLSEFLTEALASYAEVADDVTPVPVSVTENLAYIRDRIMDSTLRLLTANVIPFAVAVREIQRFVPTFSEAEMHQFVQEQTARITPADFRRLAEGAV